MRGVQLIQCNFALVTSLVQLRFAPVSIMFTQISYETIIPFVVAHWRNSQLIFVCCHKVTNNVEFTFRINNIYYLCRTGMIEWCLYDQRQTDHIIECEGNKSRSTSFSNTWEDSREGEVLESLILWLAIQYWSFLDSCWKITHFQNICEIENVFNSWIWSGAREATFHSSLFSRLGTFFTNS